MPNRPIPEQQLQRFEYISIFLRELRLNSGLTQKELSQQTSLHRNSIINAEKARNITLLSLFELADALEISPKELFLDLE